ncbi:hypothetical protein RN001_002469 [Aquatica leii]|uniref:DDE Tnp4 domain-containing protein n=1 Tax=Aquatica leii TaxID=1421715 RepID=A0AAN7SR88_9COLE|nr:hypothetical protein RN001_002469 [Aquatica leii]
MDEILEAVIVGGAGDDDIELAILHNVIIDREEIWNERAPFDINTLTDEEVVLNFRFRREDLPRLLYVFHIPNVIVTDTRNRIDADLKTFFNLSSQSISQIIKTTINIMLREKGNLLDDLNNLTWLNREKMRVYAEAIHNKGGAIDNCWGFIDGTARGICRPSIAQEEYYSGHKKYHCLKYQSAICPDGIIASFIGAYPGRRHDAAILRESNLYNQLEQKAVFGDNDKFEHPTTCQFTIYNLINR